MIFLFKGKEYDIPLPQEIAIEEHDGIGYIYIKKLDRTFRLDFVQYAKNEHKVFKDPDWYTLYVLNKKDVYYFPTKELIQIEKEFEDVKVVEDKSTKDVEHLVNVLNQVLSKKEEKSTPKKRKKKV